MDARERRAMARMMGAGAAEAPAVEVVYAEAEPRHDGLGPIIEHEVPATDREDAHRAPSRPGFGAADPAADGSDPADPDDGADAQDGDDHTPAFGNTDPIVEQPPVDDDQAGEEEYK